MLDEFVYTSSNRNSPEHKNTPVLSVKNKKQYLGGAANVALNIKKLKAIPYLVGIVGDDEASKKIYSILHSEDITNQYIHTDPRQRTTRKTRLFQDTTPVCRIDEEEAPTYEELTNHFVVKNLNDVINNHKPHAIILQDYNKGVLNATIIPQVLALAKKHNILVSTDPKLDNWNLYREVDLFKPNKSEFIAMTDNSDDTLEEKAKQLHTSILFKNLLVTLGDEGNFIFNTSTTKISQLSSPISNPDVCGAGDTVIAVSTLALVCGCNLEEIAALSNIAGRLACSKEHVKPITLEELQKG